MGRGDIKTKKGKIFAGSFGKSRPHKVKKATTAAVAPKEETKVKPKRAKAAKAAE